MPAQIRAGDTTTWTAETPDHLAADSWVLKWALVNADGQKILTATAVLTAWEVVLGAETSAAYDTGAYRWVAYSVRGITPNIERVTHEDGPVEILPDLAAATSGHDIRSTAAVLLEAVEDVLLNQAASSHAEKTISTSSGSMALKYVPRGELLAMRDQLRAEVAGENELDELNRGVGGSRRIVGRIGRTL